MFNLQNSQLVGAILFTLGLFFGCSVYATVLTGLPTDLVR